MNPQLQSLLSNKCDEGQGFSQNLNPSYHTGGLIGHTGIDVACGYGTPVAALADGLVYSTFPAEHPASDGYTAVFSIVQTPLELFEFSYGHVSEIDCAIGQQVKAGDIIAKEGNHGTVYSGNVLITPAMQAAGDHRGAHRHYQKRPVIKTQQLRGVGLQTASGIYRDEGGYYYQVYDYNNGFNGCVDWTRPLFARELGILSSGYDVLLLQRALIREGFADFQPTGYFGLLTRAAVKRLQLAHAIPETGYVGPLTRAYLNWRYEQLK
jgi:hypothetical protein